MSINASMIVDVTPRVIRANANGLELASLIFTKNSLASMCDFFTSAAQVGEQFGFESDEYKFAQTYFLADEHKTKNPRVIYFSRLTDEPTAAWLRGYKCELELEDFKKVSDGALTLTINGEEKKATGIDLSNATSLSDVATKVAAKLTGVTGAFNSAMNCFIFTTEQTGADAKITFPSATESGTDLAQKLSLTKEQGAGLWQGTDKMTFAENMNEVLKLTQNFICFGTVFEPKYEQALEMAKWVSANFGFIYVVNTTQTSAESALSKDDVASKLAAAKVSYTLPIYGDVDYCAFFMGMIAATDMYAVNGMKTYAFKSSAILASNVTDTAIAEVLKNKGYNFIGSFATRSAEFALTGFGTLLGTQYKYIDELVGQIWFVNEIQTKCVAGLAVVNSVPYDTDGYSYIRSWINDPINTGKLNGLISAGLNLSAEQKSAIMQSVGKDVSQTLYNEGWYLTIQDATAEIRNKRESPKIFLVYTYAGSVHKLEIPVTAVY